MGKIINIVTLFNNTNEVVNYAKSLSVQTLSKDIILVIVINMIDENEKKSLYRRLSEIDLCIKIFSPEKNLGYLNGLIYGYNCYTEENLPTKWIVMSNTDIKFLEADFFEKFVIKNYHDDFWLVGPSVYSIETKSFDNPQYSNRLTKKGIDKRIKIFENLLISYLYTKLSKIKAERSRKMELPSQVTYTVHGCFFFIRNEFIETIKNKVYGPLMYGEEIYLAENALRYNKKCYYDQMIRVNHEGSTVTRLLDLKKKSYYILQSLRFIRDEFFDVTK